MSSKQIEGKNHHRIKSYLIQQLNYLLLGENYREEGARDDGTSEMILEHLTTTTITRNELNDYLIQLLGHNNQTKALFDQFVDDVIIYQKFNVMNDVSPSIAQIDGNVDMESVSLLLDRIHLQHDEKQRSSSTDSEIKSSSSSATTINNPIEFVTTKPSTAITKSDVGSNYNSNTIKKSSKISRQQQSMKQDKKMKNQNQQQQQQQQQQRKQASSPTVMITKNRASTKSEEEGEVVATASASLKRTTSQQEAQPNNNINQKGIRQNSIICHCYGTKHDAMANCLHCGRITCRYEGGPNDYCPYCSYWIPPVEKPIIIMNQNNQTNVEAAIVCCQKSQNVWLIFQLVPENFSC